MPKIKSILAACCLSVACLYPAAESAAQAQSGTVGAEVIRRTLLGPGAWLMNFPDNTLGFLTGNAILNFRVSDQAMTVRIEIPSANVSCERPVVLTAHGMTLNGCRETGIEMRFTPDDPVFAFRGASSQRWYTLRPHQ